VQDVDIIDVSKIDRSAEGFAKLEVGMTLQQVGQIVGIPAANDSEDASVLYYLCTNGKTYMLTYQDAGTELTYVKAEMVKTEEG